MSYVHALMSDPDENPQFRRRWAEDSDMRPPEMPPSPTPEEAFGEIAMALLAKLRRLE